jgi:small multidrug resistance pump
MGVVWVRNVLGAQHLGAASWVHSAGSMPARPPQWERDSFLGYVYLALAIAAEVLGTSLLKSTEGFSRLWPSVWCLASYGIAFALLSQVIKSVPVGVAYALWSGLGTVAIVAIGAVFLGEELNLMKVLGIALVVAGVVVLNVGGAH